MTQLAMACAALFYGALYLYAILICRRAQWKWVGPLLCALAVIGLLGTEGLRVRTLSAQTSSDVTVGPMWGIEAVGFLVQALLIVAVAGLAAVARQSWAGCFRFALAYVAILLINYAAALQLRTYNLLLLPIPFWPVYDAVKSAPYPVLGYAPPFVAAGLMLLAALIGWVGKCVSRRYEGAPRCACGFRSATVAALLVIAAVIAAFPFGGSNDFQPARAADKWFGQAKNGTADKSGTNADTSAHVGQVAELIQNYSPSGQVYKWTLTKKEADVFKCVVGPVDGSGMQLSLDSKTLHVNDAQVLGTADEEDTSSSQQMSAMPGMESGPGGPGGFGGRSFGQGRPEGFSSDGGTSRSEATSGSARRGGPRSDGGF